MCPLTLDFSLLDAILTFTLGSATASLLIMLHSARELFSGWRDPPPEGSLPPVTILKPLKGLDVELYENLLSLCGQDYPDIQLVCGVTGETDPAAAVVRRLQREHPHLDITLVVDPRDYGANHKVSNLHNMYRHAKHDVIVIADSDIRVGRDYLRRLVPPLQNPKVGAVTCLYRAVRKDGLPTLIESLFINTDFCGMVMVARKVERATYAFGATIALRRAVLEEIGGFLPIANYLADDYQLGNRVARRGYSLVLSDQVVDTITRVKGWRHLLQHQLRWARTYRVCRPRGYFASIVTHASFWAVVNAAAHGFSAPSCTISLALLCLRQFAAHRLCQHHLGCGLTARELLLVIPKDLLVSMVWFLAFLGNTVTWSERRFRVLRSGEMVDITERVAAKRAKWEASRVSTLSDRD
jgi:ceramide glucosyltransferase